VDLSISLPEDGLISLKIYDIRGRLVKRLLEERLSKGDYRIEWNGKGREGKKLTGGVYFLKLETPTQSIIKKVILLR